MVLSFTFSTIVSPTWWTIILVSWFPGIFVIVSMLNRYDRFVLHKMVTSSGNFEFVYLQLVAFAFSALGAFETIGNVHHLSDDIQQWGGNVSCNEAAAADIFDWFLTYMTVSMSVAADAVSLHRRTKLIVYFVVLLLLLVDLFNFTVGNVAVASSPAVCLLQACRESHCIELLVSCNVVLVVFEVKYFLFALFAVGIHNCTRGRRFASNALAGAGRAGDRCVVDGARVRVSRVRSDWQRDHCPSIVRRTPKTTAGM